MKRSVARLWRRRFALFLRALAVVLSLQLSGAAHAVEDLLHLVATECSVDEHHHDCDDDERRDCPPGAADCHHPHSNVIPPGTLAELLAALTWLAPGERLALLFDDSTPPRVSLPALERPPRFARA